MKSIHYILFLFILPCTLLGQRKLDLTSVDKKNLYQGIIYSTKNECVKANKYLNTFIQEYRGADNEYWISKAKSYLLQCTDLINEAPPLEYVYRPRIDIDISDDNISDIHEEEFVASDPEIVRDIYRHTFDFITSLAPEVVYPLIEMEEEWNDPPNNTDIHLEEFVAPDPFVVRDIYRHTFDLITSLNPESFYSIIDVSLDLGENNSITSTGIVTEDMEDDDPLQVIADHELNLTKNLLWVKIKNPEKNLNGLNIEIIDEQGGIQAYICCKGQEDMEDDHFPTGISKSPEFTLRMLDLKEYGMEKGKQYKIIFKDFADDHSINVRYEDSAGNPQLSTRTVTEDMEDDLDLPTKTITEDMEDDPTLEDLGVAVGSDPLVETKTITEDMEDEPTLEDLGVTAGSDPLVETKTITEDMEDEPTLEDLGVTAGSDPLVETKSITEDMEDEPTLEDLSVTVGSDPLIETKTITEDMEDDPTLEDLGVAIGSDPLIETKTITEDMEDEPTLEDLGVTVGSDPLVETKTITEDMEDEPTLEDLGVTVESDPVLETKSITEDMEDDPPLTKSRATTGDMEDDSMGKNNSVNEEQTSIKELSALLIENKSEHFKVLFMIRDNPDESFLSLSETGPVYSYPTENGLYYRYFIGHAETLEEAKAIQQKLFSNGYKATSIRKYDQGVELATIKTEIASDIVKTALDEIPSNKTVKQETRDTGLGPEITYRVLLGS